MTNDMQESARLSRAERDKLFLELHQEGLTLSDIRTVTGSAEETVRRALHRQGVTWKRRPDARKPGPRPTDTMADALCGECGNIRTAKANHVGYYSRRLRCTVCGGATEHFGVNTDYASDRRERCDAEQNLKNAPLFAQLEASLAVLDQLGIRFELVETDEWCAKVWRKRGRGSAVCFIDLAADPTLAEQIQYLAIAWRYLLPAGECLWLNPWVQDDEDPEMEWTSIWWPRS